MAKDNPHLPAEDVVAYSIGLVYCAVCAPKGMSREVVVAKTNKKYPTGISSPWTISDEPKFGTGQPNPCACDTDDRLHYLMSC